MSRGEDVLLDIEVNGGMNARRLRPEAVLIFLAAPSFQELEYRLRNRGDTSPELVERRLEQARWEYSQAPKYDYIVVNDDLEQAVNDFISILSTDKFKTDRNLELINNILNK